MIFLFIDIRISHENLPNIFLKVETSLAVTVFLAQPTQAQTTSFACNLGAFNLEFL
jgi:hypothetical protein